MGNLKCYSSNCKDARTETPFTFAKDPFAITIITGLAAESYSRFLGWLAVLWFWLFI